MQPAATAQAADVPPSGVFAPVTNRGEAIGVLELLLGEPPDEQVLAEVAFAAHALAYVIIANRRFTDLFEWGQRSVPLSLAAEIQHRLLPGSYTCEAGQFTIAGWLEPAGNVGGDTFDFALERGMLHFSLTDAMGHEVGDALLATLMIGGLRNARRRAGIEAPTAITGPASRLAITTSTEMPKPNDTSTSLTAKRRVSR